MKKCFFYTASFVLNGQPGFFNGIASFPDGLFNFKDVLSEATASILQSNSTARSMCILSFQEISQAQHDLIASHSQVMVEYARSR